jgi:hypothetical protein
VIDTLFEEDLDNEIKKDLILNKTKLLELISSGKVNGVKYQKLCTNALKTNEYIFVIFRNKRVKSLIEEEIKSISGNVNAWFEKITE